MRNSLVRKGLVVAIIVLFVGASVIPTISGTISKKAILKDASQTNIQSPGFLSKNSVQTMASLTCYAFDETGMKDHAVVLLNSRANDVYETLEELKYKMTHDPFSDETQNLKIEFVDILDVNGLIPAGLSKAYMLSLLNPSWLDWIQNNACATNNIVLPSKNIMQSILRNQGEIIQQQIAQNHIAAQKVYPVNSGATGKTRLIQDDTVPSFNDFNGINGGSEEVIPVTYTSTASAMFCSIGSGGAGIIMPLILLPRPRLIAVWAAPDAITSVGNLLSIGGFTAIGAQAGMAVGFTGIGLTFAFPTETLYGFVGYALFTSVSAEVIERFPPNRAPVISDENPPSGSRDIPVSLSKLSFRIEDADGDRMSYTVTTEPDIGSGSGIFKKNGVYSVSVSGLESDKVYRWTVEVTDGKDTTEKQFSFFTEAGPPFDPFDEGWQYRKQITINHTKVAGDLTDFPVLISTIDTDLRDKAQDDGDDILFMDGPGVANKVYHEIEEYDDSSGELVAWVNVVDISADEDTVLYLYYGNPGCSDQQFPVKVWDSTYVMVQHMDIKGSTIYDSTSHSNDGSLVSSPYNVDGVIGNAIQFDGVDDAVSVPDDVSLRPADVTLELWGKATGSVGWLCYKRATDKWGNGDGHAYGLNTYMSGGTRYFQARYERNNNNQQHAVGNSPGNNDTWYYLVTTYDEAHPGRAKFYFNGSLAATDNTMESEIIWYNAPNYDLVWGSCRGDYYNFTGDETRISNIVRSAEWLSTSYNTMSDPSSFVSFGPEESGP